MEKLFHTIRREVQDRIIYRFIAVRCNATDIYQTLVTELTFYKSNGVLLDMRGSLPVEASEFALGRPGAELQAGAILREYVKDGWLIC